MEDQVLDALLTRYLALLDEYTTLRAALHTRQAALFQQLARANYAAAAAGAGGGGGRRYGADYYDGRMQACRRVVVRGRVGGGSGGEGHDGEVDGGEGGVRDGEDGAGLERGEGRAAERGAVVDAGLDEAGVTEPAIRFAVVEASDLQDGTRTQHDGPGATEEANAQQVPASEKGEDQGAENTEDDGTSDTEGEKKPQARPKPHDPLRWFGILTPPALREAQRHAVAAVEDIIPQLATLSTEMARIELEVRRARKRRAKAEKAEQKKLLDLEERMGQVGVSA